MKTIGDLKRIIKENNNDLVIGEISFTYQEGEDIDGHFHGSLVQWYSKDISDDVLLSEVQPTISSSIEEEDKARKENRELKKKNEELEKTAQEIMIEVSA